MCGPFANIAGSLLIRGAGREHSMSEGLVDGIGSLAKRFGLETKTGTAALYHVRKKVASVPDDGGTAISASPIPKFPGIGQFAEVTVRSTRAESTIGCVGIGVTTFGPEKWEAMRCFDV